MKSIKAPLLMVSLVLSTSPARAQKAPETDVPLPPAKATAFNAETKARMNVPIQHRWSFAPNSDDVPTLRSILRLRAPGGKTLTEPSGPDVRTKGAMAMLPVDSLNQSMTFSDTSGATETAVVQIRFKGPLVVRQRSCLEQRIELESPKDLPAAFYLALSCTAKGEEVLLGLSAPSDWDWRSASLVDEKGKGEPWKLYRTKNADGNLLQFELARAGRSARFSIRKKEDEAKQRRESQEQALIEVALAGHSAGISVTNADPRASSGPGFLLEGRSRAILGGLFAYGGASYMASAASDDAVDYTEFGLGGGFRWALGPSFALIPRAGFSSLSSGNSALGVRLTHAHLSAGLAFDVALGAMLLTPSFDLGSLGSNLASGHSVIGLKLRRLQGFRWSLGVRLQNFKTTSQTGVERAFQQTSLSLGYLF